MLCLSIDRTASLPERDDEWYCVCLYSEFGDGSLEFLKVNNDQFWQLQIRKVRPEYPLDLRMLNSLCDDQVSH